MVSTIVCKNCKKIYGGGVCPKCGTYNELITEEEEKRIKEDKKRIKEEEKRIKEEKYQNKKYKRDEINEKYGFTNDEIFRLYHNEAKQADKIYKAFVTDGISRLDKINGRFLASQLRKLDVLSQQNNHIIQQNDEIIKLLKEIVENTK